MTEQALQQYLIKQYPKEDEGCEWKEFKNLKNDFSGHEKDDVISYVSALANMEGGHLVVGVEDKTLRIVGTDTNNYDVQKARLRLIDQCANLPSEGLLVEEFITDDIHKTVWVIHVPRHMKRQPVYAHNKAWQRLDDSLIELTDSRRMRSWTSRTKWKRTGLHRLSMTQLLMTLILARLPKPERNSLNCIQNEKQK